LCTLLGGFAKSCLRHHPSWAKITKDMGRYKVETLAQHDSMQPYKLEMVSYNTSCPLHKIRFHQVVIFMRKNKETCFFKFKHYGIEKTLLEYPIIFGYPI